LVSQRLVEVVDIDDALFDDLLEFLAAEKMLGSSLVATIDPLPILTLATVEFTCFQRNELVPDRGRRPSSTRHGDSDDVEKWRRSILTVSYFKKRGQKPRLLTDSFLHVTNCQKVKAS
jgi:hypothetical protein